MDPTFRMASVEDTLGMARVYLAAFPESLAHFFRGHPPLPQAVADLLAIPLLAEPGCGVVALVGDEIAGYSLAPSQLSDLRRGLRGGHLWRILGRWLSGRYRIGLRSLWRLARNKLHMSRPDPHHAEAHILSIAVHPERQGMGLGKELLRRSLEYLASRGATRIRLEVRPDNAPAIHLYARAGFQTVSTMSDLQGEWLVMIREAGA